MYEPGLAVGSYMTVKQFAERIGVSRSAVYRSVRAGHLRGLRLSPAGDIRIPASELQRLFWLEGTNEERLEGGREQ